MNEQQKNTHTTQPVDWGCIAYREAWDRQKELVQRLTEQKERQQPLQERIVLCTHPSVYTLGKHGNPGNMLASARHLEHLGVELVQIERGGDITYHGPGQLVCYPIIDLEWRGWGIKKYIYTLEESVIKLCSRYGIHAERLLEATGVWVRNAAGRMEKVAAIGVKCTHFVTMHGLALNINPDMNFFQMINPCGITDKGVTSLAQLLNTQPDFDEVKKQFTQEILSLTA